MVILTSTENQQYDWSCRILCNYQGVQNYHVSRRFSAYIMKRQMKTVPPFVIVCPLDRLSQQLRLADFLKNLAL